MDYTATITTAANNAGVPPALALAVASHESGLNPNAINSKSGATGLFQLMPTSFPGQNISDPVTNIDLGVGYLGTLLNKYNGDISLALAAYNAGPGTVATYGGVPPYAETQNYVSSILSTLGLGSGANVSALTYGDNGSSNGDSTDDNGSGDSSIGSSFSDMVNGLDTTTLVAIGVVGVVGLVYLFK